MKLRLVIALSILFCCGAATGFADDADRAAEHFFETKIRPVLASTCSKCHGSQKAGNSLRVDSRDALLKGGDTGPAVVPGDPEQSLLIRALRYSDDLQMPPDNKLADEVVRDFERWIRGGAVWPKNSADPFREQRHWSFQPLAEVTVPAESGGNWAETEIDRFIAARQNEQGLKPVGLADQRTLLRRACFDLTGLPPTPEQLSEFAGDSSPDAYERLIERLLSSPQYGERWGRHWMDLVHYCDTAGDNADFPVPELYLYRDYVIDSFNSDKPFDQFVREQLAGDILAKNGPRERYAEQVIATGFIALARSYGSSPYDEIYLRIEDTIETLGCTFLGLNLRCARCHDHKFDPVTTADYYSLYAMFASTTYPWAGSSSVTTSGEGRKNIAPLVPKAEISATLQQYQEDVRSLEEQIKQAETAGKPKSEIDSLRLELKRLKRPGLPPGVPGAYAVTDGAPVKTFIQLQGNPRKRGKQVTAAVPAFLTPAEPIAFPGDSSGRLQLADWLVDEKNPLTARVIVNRVWQHHFGRGIVGTPSDFGLRGEPPTHPELLDWLARTFMAEGWSIKKLHRRIMLSKTYRLASDFDEKNSAIDPDNRLRWRFDRHRLDAEALRDALLSVSGQLDLSRPKAQPFPAIEQWTYQMTEPFLAVYPSTHRSVYLMTQRMQQHPYLALFDGANTSVTTAKRTESTVPLQSLFLMNSDFVHQAAGHFAERLQQSGQSTKGMISLAHRWAYGRNPTVAEIDRGVEYLSQYRQELTRGGRPEAEARRISWTSYAKLIFAANEFRYID